jgi:hypothetical protein
VKLFSLYTESHRALKDEWFLRTLKDDFSLNLRFWEPGQRDCGDFRSTQWLGAAEEKLKILEWAVRENQNEIILWCDVDVQFFRPCAQIFEEAIQNADLAFMHEQNNTDINAGVIVIRCNQRTLDFFTTASRRGIEGFFIADQSLMEHLLRSCAVPGLRWNLLPDQVFGPSQLASINREQMLSFDTKHIPDDIALHHANMTVPAWGKTSIQLKVDQLQQVRRIVESRASAPLRQRYTSAAT